MTLKVTRQPVERIPSPSSRRRESKHWQLAAVVTLVSLAACSSPPANAPQPAVTQFEAAANDALLTTEVKAKLITVDIDSTASLGVHVVHGVATLTGAVRTTAARERTIAAAKSVQGIRVVHDDLRVDPRVPNVTGRMGDAALAGRIAAAIFTQTGSTAVRVDVHQGVVTLRGSVTDPRLRDAAVDTARDTSGVKHVVDDMGAAGM
jgi:osmotically-inducible protein OsmY